MRKYYTALLLLLLIGCSENFKNLGGNTRRMFSSYGEKVEKFISISTISKDTEYAYVIGRMNTRNEWTHTSIPYNKTYSPKFMAIELAFVERPGFLGEKKYGIYKLKAGKYTLTHFSFGNAAPGGVIYTSTTAAKDENEKLKDTGSKFASFTVQAGKVYYLGDVYLDVSSLNVSHNTTAMNAYVFDNYPNLRGIEIEQGNIELGEYYKR
jgi:hypothetical protein